MIKYVPIYIEFGPNSDDPSKYEIKHWGYYTKFRKEGVGNYWDEVDTIGHWGGCVMAKNIDHAEELLYAERAKRQCKLTVKEKSNV
jgi:hypothetical protein